MVRMSKKALLELARSLNATDLTNDNELRPGLGLYAKIAYSEGKYGCNGCILVNEYNKFFVITDRTPALWVYVSL